MTQNPDPPKVKAGDTVTVTRGKAIVVDTVGAVDHSDLGGVGPLLRLYETDGWYRLTGPDAWEVTDHQPAPEPEPEWKPGTVAVVVKPGDPGAGDGDVEFQAALDIDCIWRSFDDTERTPHIEGLTEVRPLVVIDPAAVDVGVLAKKAQQAYSSAPWGENAFVKVVRSTLTALGIEVAR